MEELTCAMKIVDERLVWGRHEFSWPKCLKGWGRLIIRTFTNFHGRLHCLKINWQKYRTPNAIQINHHAISWCREPIINNLRIFNICIANSHYFVSIFCFWLRYIELYPRGSLSIIGQDNISPCPNINFYIHTHFFGTKLIIKIRVTYQRWCNSTSSGGDVRFGVHCIWKFSENDMILFLNFGFKKVEIASLN